MERYARVLVDVAGQELEQGFDYRIPADYPCAVSPGMSVTVPFGKRKLAGLVLEIMQKTDVPPDRIRDMGPPRYDGEAVSEEMIRLALWMAHRYHCSVQEAVRCVLPPGTRADKAKPQTYTKPVLNVSKEAAGLFIDTCPPSRKRQILLMELLLSDAGIGQIRAKLPEWQAVAHALEKKGLVRTETAVTQRIPYEQIPVEPDTEPELMPEQEQAIDRIRDAMASGSGTFYLFGVTGSGKTEVYLQCAKYAMQTGRSTIILVPEISLTPQMVKRFRARFGESVCVFHSALTLAERRDQWQRVKNGTVKVAVGARSAIFAPFDDLGLIVVDEEHETSYLSEHAPRYDAVEVAQERCRIHGATLLLGSATPSLGRYAKALDGSITLLKLNGRVRGLPMPEVSIVDMREELKAGNRSMFSGQLKEAIQNALFNGQQIVLFLNRRGYHTFVSCRDCGEAVKCPHCDVSMTYHRTQNRLVCHYCGFEMYPPRKCPSCGSTRIRYFGAGTQRVEDELQTLFPGVKTLRMDRDTTRTKDSHEQILSAFGKGEAQILLGTQMVAKGLDFPNITVVGVLAADTALHAPDYTGAERTFQLIAQVAGRAGRGNTPGRVVVQTYSPEEAAIRLAAQHDYPAFYEDEMKRRQEGQFPPFTRFIRFLFTDTDGERAKNQCERFAEFLKTKIRGEKIFHGRLLQFRCTESPLARIDNRYRYQIVLKMTEDETADDMTEDLMRWDDEFHTGQTRPVMEINPHHMV